MRHEICAPLREDMLSGTRVSLCGPGARWDCHIGGDADPSSWYSDPITLSTTTWLGRLDQDEQPSSISDDEWSRLCDGWVLIVEIDDARALRAWRDQTWAYGPYTSSEQALAAFEDLPEMAI